MEPNTPQCAAPTIKAACCKAIYIVDHPSWVDVRKAVKASFFGGRQRDKDAIGFFSHMDPLPASIEDWEPEIREFARHYWDPSAVYFQCKAIGKDGLCSIYDRRPLICREFLPCAAIGCSRCASFGTSCVAPPSPTTVLDLEKL